jgi:hypothetical protein
MLGYMQQMETQTNSRLNVTRIKTLEGSFSTPNKASSTNPTPKVSFNNNERYDRRNRNRRPTTTTRDLRTNSGSLNDEPNQPDTDDNDSDCNTEFSEMTNILLNAETDEDKDRADIFVNRSLRSGDNTFVRAIAQESFQQGEDSMRKNGPTLKQATEAKIKERDALITRLANCEATDAFGEPLDDVNIHEAQAHLEQTLINVNYGNFNSNPSHYGNQQGNHHGNGNHNQFSPQRSNGQMQQRRPSNYGSAPFVPKCQICGLLMDGIKHPVPGSPCSLIDDTGKLSIDKITDIARNDGQEAIRTINAITTQGALGKELLNMARDYLLTTVNTAKANPLTTK